MIKLTHKITTALTSVALLAGTAACAQTQTLPAPVAETKVPAADVEMAPKTAAGPALWQVSDEDTTVYLFGTVHFLPEGTDWFKGEVAEAFTASETLVTEIDSSKLTPEDTQKAIMQLGLLPQGQTVRGLLSDEDRAEYERVVGAFGMPPAVFDPFQPWYVGLTVTVLQFQKIGFQPNAGVEAVLQEKSADKERQSLETLEFQFGQFAKLSDEMQIKFLMEAINGVDEVEPFLDKMLAEWLEGDADALAELMNEGMNDPDAAEQLLYARNRNWAEWIDTRMDTPGTVFIAVGAGHLAGDNSLQDYLSERGIQSARVQ